MLVRIDNRLIHGQIIETWVPHVGAQVVVVVNDELAADEMQQQIMSLAIPGNVQCEFLSVDNFADKYAQSLPAGGIILFHNCPDAKRAFDKGAPFDILNIGNVHYSPGKKQVSPSVALSDEDESALRQLSKKGVELDFRCVPNDPVQVRF